MQKQNSEIEQEIAPVPDNVELQELAKKEETKFNSLILKDKELLEDATRNGMRYSMFWNQTQRELFGTAAKYWVNNQALLTRSALETILDQNDKLSAETKVKFRSLYDDLYYADVSKEDYAFLKESIESRDMQRQMIHVLKKYSSIHSQKSGIKKIVEAIQRDIAAIQSASSDVFIRTKRLSEALVEEVLPEIIMRRDNPEHFRGIMSGFQCVDSVFNGFLPGKYLVFSGRPNGGKTTVMMNFGINMADFSKKNVAIVTIEDDLKKCSTRALTIATEINFNRIMRGGTSDQHGLCEPIMNKLTKGISEISGPGGFGERLFFIETLPGTKWSTIVGDINRIMSYTNLDVIIVDYLDEVGKEVSYPNRPDLELADVSKRIQSFGKKNNILAVTAQQLRSEKVRDLQKKGMSAENFKVGVGDISGSQKIAAAADYIFALWMDEDSQDRMHLFSTKSRHSKALDKFMLSIDCNSGRMSDAPTNFETLEEYVISNKDHLKEKELDSDAHNVSSTNVEVMAAAPVVVQPVVEAGIQIFSPATDMWPFNSSE